MNLNQKEILNILNNKKLTPTALKLLLFFLSELEEDSRVKGYTQKTISEMLLITQQQVSLAIKELIDKNILTKVEKDYYLCEGLITR